MERIWSPPSASYGSKRWLRLFGQMGSSGLADGSGALAITPAFNVKPGGVGSNSSRYLIPMTSHNLTIKSIRCDQAGFDVQRRSLRSSALARTTSFRMIAVMAILACFPLAMSRS